MTTLSEVQQINRDLADRINRETLADPASPYAGKYVGIANGQVVAVGASLDEALDRLRQIEPDPARCACVEASRDYSIVEYIWEQA